MNDILKLKFDRKEYSQYLLIQSDCVTVDDLTLTDFVEIHYHGSFTYRMTWNEMGYILKFELIDVLKDLLDNKFVLDKSIKKSLGYYDAQYQKNTERKNLKYQFDDEGEKYWVGSQYEVFGSAYRYKCKTWFYNDEQGNIWFELSPIYPWSFGLQPDPGETFIKYSQWLKEFRPYVVRQISREVAQEWVEKLEKLLKIVEVNDKRLSCTGPGCNLCKQEGSEVYKQFCGDCKDCEKIHNES